MNYMALILVGIVVLGWRLRRDNAKRDELLERISRQQTPRRPQAKPKLVVKKPRPKIVLAKHKFKH